ncbi:MAG: hypothetical protein V1871_01075 [Planctomycetota bacterium]
MRITLKRAAIYISLLLILCLAPGCIYLRLLKFQNQLADFDRCFQVNEEKGLKIICLKPVLYNDDIKTMLAPPTISNKTKQNEQWTYVFEKQYPDNHKTDEGDFDISLDMAFKDDLLNEIHLPERFLVILPKTFLITICKTMGNAQVNKKEYSAKGTYESKEKNQIQVPKQNDVLKFLGNPFVWREVVDDAKLFYRYRLKQKTTLPETGLPKTASDNNAPFVWVEFTFRKTDGTLLKAEANLCGIELSLSFVPDTKKDEEKR